MCIAPLLFKVLKLPQQALVDVQILLSGIFPREVSSHTLFLDAAPSLFVVVVQVYRFAEDPDHIAGADVSKGKASAGALVFVIRGDAVF